LREYCRGKLSAFTLPDHFEFYDALPRNPTGKFIKSQLAKKR
jgi:acyl-CoA synthetase (AMP-forming)/AMP-acid ligase II